MKKIPTLFVRDPESRRFVLPEVTPGCEWVLAGEGMATRKYDGTCVLIRRDGLVPHGYARREVKPDRAMPSGFVEVEHDEVTGKTVGWEPIHQSGFARFYDEAVAERPTILPGTYELCGPKINGDPEQFGAHVLVKHATAEEVPWASMIPTDPAMAHAFLAAALHEAAPMEGIVWHHPDGRMAKLKRRDFPVAAPDTEGRGQA